MKMIIKDAGIRPFKHVNYSMDKMDEKWLSLYEESDSSITDSDHLEAKLHLDSSRFDEEEIIGSGGMKTITQKRDRATGRHIAVATLNIEEKFAVEAFLREAKIQARLEHSNIPPIYEIGISEDKKPFFIMRLIKGQTLKELILEDSHTLNSLLDIFIKICNAMNYAHSQKIIHLDLKPDNIMVNDFGEVQVCDWGLAKYLEEDELDFDYDLPELQNLTLHGQIKGTPGYMAPEQIKNEAKDHRTDIFALGCILYEILTSQSVFSGSPDKLMKRTLKDSIRPPIKIRPDLPESLNSICMKCLQFEPDSRYQSMHEILTDIHSYTSGYSVSSEKTSLIREIFLLYKRNKLVSNIIINCLILIFISLIYYTSILAEKQNKIESTLNEIKIEQKKNNKIAKQANNLFFDRIENCWTGSQFKKMHELLETVFIYSPENEDALLYKAQLLIVQKKFKKANDILKNLENKNLLKISQNLIDKKVTIMGYKSLFNTHYELRSNYIYNELNQLPKDKWQNYLQTYLSSFSPEIEVKIDFEKDERINLTLTKSTVNQSRLLEKLPIKSLKIINSPTKDFPEFILNSHRLEKLDLSEANIYYPSLRELKSLKEVNIASPLIGELHNKMPLELQTLIITKKQSKLFELDLKRYPNTKVIIKK